MIEMEYNVLITYKVKDLIEIIVQKKEISFLSAIEYLYSSNLYEYLSDESMKIWHLSSFKLFEVLENEKSTNVFIMPDFN